MVERTRVTPTSAEVLFRSASTGGGSAGVYTWIRAEVLQLIFGVGMGYKHHTLKCNPPPLFLYVTTAPRWPH